MPGEPAARAISWVRNQVQVASMGARSRSQVSWCGEFCPDLLTRARTRTRAADIFVAGARQHARLAGSQEATGKRSLRCLPRARACDADRVRRSSLEQLAVGDVAERVIAEGGRPARCARAWLLAGVDACRMQGHEGERF